MTRPSWEEYALTLARAAATRSEDPWIQVGACVLRHNRTVAAIGYNGAPAGITMNWSDRDKRRRWVLHAEANALRYVLPDEGALMATTLMPCLECLKLTRAQGIMRIVYADTPLRPQAADILEVEAIAKAFGVSLERISV